ncbi:uncharacterized protein JCM15063_005109 [Sporobolomyces koalae]|uniref:uncharacterized protein n=1 Tax=Sporobolomyces koalae TaxID=500713 RepID=UPI00317A794E
MQSTAPVEPTAPTGAVPPESALTEAHLRAFTLKNGVGTRPTVAIYLNSIRNAQGYFEIPRDRIQGSTSPCRHNEHHVVDAQAKTMNEPPTKRRRLDIIDRAKVEDTALVMHLAAPKNENQQTKGSVPLKKKPSLVSAMRPRFVPTTNTSSSPVAKSGVKAEKPRKYLSHGSTSDAEKENQDKSRVRRNSQSQRKSGHNAKEEKKELVHKSDKSKGKLRMEPETEKEAAELEERLEARKQRRRNKAFSRKDRSQPAAATGAAAALRVKKPKKHDGSDREESAAEGREADKKRKKGRRSAEQSGRDIVQGLHRPGGVGLGRLTLRSSTQLGIFNKGKASVRARVGRAVPDLAFSEMRFLNSTRSPEPEHADLTASVSEAEDGHHSTSRRRRVSAPKTYGTKPKTDLRAVSSEAGGASTTQSSECIMEKDKTTERSSAVRRVRHRFSHVEIPPMTSRLTPLPESVPPSPSNAIISTSQPGVPVTSRSAIEFATADAEESPLSAHSAQSLALRRQSRMDLRNKSEQQHTPCNPDPHVQLHKVTPAVAANPILDDTLSPLLDTEAQPLATFTVKESQNLVLPAHSSEPAASTLGTQSIARLAFDNSSYIGPMQTLAWTRSPAHSSQCPGSELSNRASHLSDLDTPLLYGDDAASGSMRFSLSESFTMASKEIEAGHSEEHGYECVLPSRIALNGAGHDLSAVARRMSESAAHARWALDDDDVYEAAMARYWPRNVL